MGSRRESDWQRIATRRRLILLLECGGQERAALERMLAGFGYNVSITADEQQAMECMQIVLPSLIIVDTERVDAASYGLIGRLKQEQGGERIPVIVLSRIAPQKAEEAIMRRKVAAFLLSPVNTEELFRVVQSAMEETPRRNIRSATRLQAFRDDATESGFATQLSESGMFYETAEPAPVHSKHPVRIIAGNREIRAEAEVLYRSLSDDRSRRAPGMGMQFTRITSDDQNYLRLFILLRLRKSAHLSLS